MHVGVGVAVEVAVEVEVGVADVLVGFTPTTIETPNDAPNIWPSPLAIRQVPVYVPVLFGASSSIDICLHSPGGTGTLILELNLYPFPPILSPLAWTKL